MLARGLGELSGTSMAPKPASTMTAANASASAGVDAAQDRRRAASAPAYSVTGAPRPARCEKARARRRAAAPRERRRRAPRTPRGSAGPAPRRRRRAAPRPGIEPAPPRRFPRRSGRPDEISAGVVLIERAHQRESARAEQEAKDATLRLAARGRSAALNPERERVSRRLRRRGLGERAGDRVVPQRLRTIRRSRRS